MRPRPGRGDIKRLQTPVVGVSENLFDGESGPGVGPDSLFVMLYHLKKRCGSLRSIPERLRLDELWHEKGIDAHA